MDRVVGEDVDAADPSPPGREPKPDVLPQPSVFTECPVRRTQEIPLLQRGRGTSQSRKQVVEGPSFIPEVHAATPVSRSTTASSDAKASRSRLRRRFRRRST